MRITLAALACLSLGGFAVAGDAAAAVRKPTDIPAQELGTALTKLAKEFDFQVLYRTEIIGDVRSHGAIGIMTSDEALGKVLGGTGFTYKYLDDKTVTVLRMSDATSRQTATASTSGSSAGASTSKEAGKKSSRDFRLAQLDQGVAGGATSLTPTAQSEPAESQAQLEEVMVTATRREENINTVPVSVTAFDTAKLDDQGIVTVDDLARMVPGVTFQRSGFDTSNISIRGISSTAGTATTGIYIDDTPVQVRTLGFAATNLYPENFDLQRVEVLRGPQGTLFGSGSEGGTVRFITVQPSVTEYTGYARADASYMQSGSPNAEAGAAFGGPLLRDRLGFRVSAWFGHEGGYIDRVSPIDGSTLDNNANRANNYAIRAALRFEPTDAIDATLATYTQYQHENTSSYYYERISDPAQHDFRAAEPIGSPAADRYWLTSLNVQAKLGDKLSLISLTSDLTRQDTAASDYSHFIPSILFGPSVWNNSLSLPLAGAPYNYYESQVHFPGTQNNFVQELRLQTRDTGPVSGTLGVFYSLARQADIESIYDPTLPQLTQTYFGASVAAALGVPMIPPAESYISRDAGRDKQTAIFGDFGYEIVPGLKADAGFRYQWSSFEYTSIQSGPFAGATSGVPESASQRAHPVNPRFYLSYQIDDKNMVYASASKGFRIGGANRPIPVTTTACEDNVQALGYPNTPPSYDPDSLWNYEVGSKNGALNGRLQLNASLFFVKWSNIQQSVFLPSCGSTFVANLGSAVSKGGDIQADWLVTRDLSLNLSVAYTDAYFSSGVSAGSGTTLVTNGDGLATSPWDVAGTATYRFSLMGLSSFARFTYSFQSHLSRLTPANNPDDSGSNPLQVNPPAQRYATLRLGADLSQGVEASLYCDNLFDSSPVLSQYNDVVGSRLIYANTLTPRTIGGRVTYRF